MTEAALRTYEEDEAGAVVLVGDGGLTGSHPASHLGPVRVVGPDDLASLPDEEVALIVVDQTGGDASLVRRVLATRRPDVPVAVRTPADVSASTLFALGASEVLGSAMVLDEQRARLDRLLDDGRERRALTRRLVEMEAAAGEDPLTGLANRRRLDELTGLIAAGADRRHEPLGVLIIDVDRLKRINDVHGHGAGDLALQHVAAILQATIRGGDVLGRPDDQVVGRWAGDEFLVALAPATRRGLEALTHRLLGAVRASPLPLRDGRLLSVTVTIGAAGGAPDPAALLGAADRALYRAKRQSRDMACVDHRDD
jgi:diguanylate cyclase (GGDEF)-like protein